MDKLLRYQHYFSIIMVDLDNFKYVNDTYGHQAGDSVLIELASILKNNTSSVDIVGRWGGEELLIICPETNLDNTVQLAEKIRTTIDSYNFKVVGHKTASFGVSSYHENDSIEFIIERADKALYCAKEERRNQVKAETLGMK